MAKEEFVFKKKWLDEAHKRLSLHCIGYFVILVVEYGLYGKHEEILDEYKCITRLLNEVKREIDSENTKPQKKPKMKIPPTLDEVIQFIKDNNLNVDPYQFWNFYESKGWFVGKNKMKNWHSAIATWLKRNQTIYNNGTTGQQSNVIDKVADILAD